MADKRLDQLPVKANPIPTDIVLVQDVTTKQYFQSPFSSLSSGGVAAASDATTSAKGIVQLAGDLGGTAALPIVKTRVALTVGTSNADYITDGTADQVEIQAAIDAVSVAGGGIVQLRAGTFTLSDTLKLKSNVTLQGMGAAASKLFMAGALNKTVINNFDFDIGITTRVGIRNLTIDQNAANQTTGGGGVVTSGMQDWIIENVVFEKSYKFNFLALHSSGSIANGAGTITLTNGSEIVIGTTTTFLTSFAENDIIKTAGGRFGRVAKVVSDTSLQLTRIWGHATETGVTYKKILPNSGNKFINIRAKGTVNDADAMGFGFCDYSIVENCTASGAAGGGCGFVPDHSRAMQIIGCEAFGNNNSGLSFETCQDITVLGGKFYGNGDISGNGIQLISGTYNVTITGVHSYSNKSNGLIINYNVNTFPTPDNNKIVNSYFFRNGSYGVRVDGGAGCEFTGCNAFNNTTGGFITNTAQARIPADTKFINCRAYDDRTTKVQDRGFWIVTGIDTLITNSKADGNVTAQVTDTGTSTVQINVNGITNITGLNRLLPAQTGNATKGLLTDGTNATWTSLVPWDIDTSSNNGVTRIRHSTENFLANSSYEHWNQGLAVAPDGWILSGDATVARTTTNASIGIYAAQITFGTANTGELYQAVGVSNLVDYTFSCYVNRLSGLGSARLVAQNGVTPFTEYASVPLNSNAQLQLATLTVKPGVTGLMRFAIKANGTTASVWTVDEVMLQESKAIATTWQPRMLNDSDNQNIYGQKYFGFASIFDLSVGNSLIMNNKKITNLLSGTVSSDAATFGQVDLKENLSNKGASNGYAPLDATSKVPAANLPSYVDDVIEFTNLAGFPVTGETGKIYVALDTNKTYRWSGTVYLQITSGAVDSVAGRTGIVTLTKTDVGLDNVDNTSDLAKPVSTATQTALNLKKNDSMTTNRLLGRSTAATGVIEEITLGTNLSFTGTTLNAAGGGIARSITTVTTTLTGAAVASTDYVYLLGIGAVYTQPTAVGNTNRYTLKNTTNASLTIASTSAQTFDGGPLVLQASASIDLISNNANWIIT